MIAKKEKTTAVLISELDDIISKYVRLTYADFRGFCKCVCCDTVAHWTKMDCAHFIPRSNMATRFYLPNLRPASKLCNQFDSSNHLRRWSGKMSANEWTDLTFKAKSLMKWTKPELQSMIEEYKEKVQQLKKQKHL